MRITKKVLEKAAKQINTGLFNYLSRRRWQDAYKGIENAVKTTLKDGRVFDEAEFQTIAAMNKGDEVGVSLNVWLIEAIQAIAPERVDAGNFEVFKKEAQRLGLLIPSE